MARMDSSILSKPYDCIKTTADLDKIRLNLARMCVSQVFFGRYPREKDAINMQFTDAVIRAYSDPKERMAFQQMIDPTITTAVQFLLRQGPQH